MKKLILVALLICVQTAKAEPIYVYKQAYTVTNTGVSGATFAVCRTALFQKFSAFNDLIVRADVLNTAGGAGKSVAVTCTSDGYPIYGNSIACAGSYCDATLLPARWNFTLNAGVAAHTYLQFTINRAPGTVIACEFCGTGTLVGDFISVTGVGVSP